MLKFYNSNKGTKKDENGAHDFQHEFSILFKIINKNNKFMSMNKFYVIVL